ncbi:hypothetical protein [Sphingomonas sp. TDK1]|uniref:hypothetical protein n=1 Tax=Sphingomonas sp. TDK1 TaxID=453247 RepID=UPI0007DA3462|nr:hypothetical protein [Sphingomonas sp. TDK1]OAN64918.1 hypothetical protein A7X12_16190 [Sphingomonas sp. TDK1]
MPIRTVHQSLSFDTIITDHRNRLSAEAHMIQVLRVNGDWPQDAAVDAARFGKPALVRDDGDSETIEIRDESPATPDAQRG